MKTDDSQDKNSTQDAQKKGETPLKRVGRTGLAILNPFSDLMVIYRKGLRPSMSHAREAWALLNRRSKPTESLNWAQAVAASGKTAPQLCTTFKRIRLVWWCLMMVSGGLVVILSALLLFAAGSLPAGTLLRAVFALFLLIGACGLGFVRNLITTYRLWQLQNRRVSASEGGTFKDFITENQWWRQVLSLSA